MTDTPPAISVQSFDGDGSLTLVRNYGIGKFQINDTPIDGSVFLLPRQTISWSPTIVDDITLDAVLAGLGDVRPAILLLGLGGPPSTRLWDLHQQLREYHIGLEIMSTPAACRTWNVLLSEGRDVAAGLLALRA